MLLLWRRQRQLSKPQIGHGLRPITLSHWVAPNVKQYCEAKDDWNQYACAMAPT